MKAQRSCMRKANAAPSSRCILCSEKHGKCSLVGSKPQDDPSSPPSPAKPRSKSPNILRNLAKRLTRSDDKAESDTLSPPPPTASSSAKPSGSSSRQKKMEVVIPMSKPPSIASRSSFLHSGSHDLPPPSPYSFGGNAPSYTSASTSFTSLTPDSPGYQFELERLQIRYRRSEETLRAEQEFNIAQQALHVREIATREARHREEIEALRKQLESSSKGKHRD